jgi:hypothetical protein
VKDDERQQAERSGLRDGRRPVKGWQARGDHRDGEDNQDEAEVLLADLILHQYGRGLFRAQEVDQRALDDLNHDQERDEEKQATQPGIGQPARRGELRSDGDQQRDHEPHPEHPEERGRVELRHAVAALARGDFTLIANDRMLHADLAKSHGQRDAGPDQVHQTVVGDGEDACEEGKSDKARQHGQDAGQGIMRGLDKEALQRRARHSALL